MDGDAKINMPEFSLGMKSSLKVFPKKTKRPNSSAVTGFAQKMGVPNTPGVTSKGTVLPIRRSSATPRNGATPRGGDNRYMRSSSGTRLQGKVRA